MTDGNGGPRRPVSASSILAAISKGSEPESGPASEPTVGEIAIAVLEMTAAVRELTRETRATRRLLNEMLSSNEDRDRDLNRRMDGIMDLLKEALSR